MSIVRVEIQITEDVISRVFARESVQLFTLPPGSTLLSVDPPVPRLGDKSIRFTYDDGKEEPCTLSIGVAEVKP